VAQISTLKAHGVAPAAFIWVHAQNEADTRLHVHAAERALGRIRWHIFCRGTEACGTGAKHEQRDISAASCFRRLRVVSTSVNPVEETFALTTFFLLSFSLASGPEFLQRKSRRS